MSDTFSDLLGLRYQETGGNENTWGELLNTDVFEVLENAIAGMATHAVTGGSVDLSADPLVEQVHKFTGTLSSDLTVTIPNLKKTMKVWNATSGSYYMLLKTASGTAICIPQGTIKEIVCDGANGVYRGDREEVGEIKYFGGTTVPNGYFECDGATPSRTLTPDLFAKIGTTWGTGNGSTTYTLPDLKTAGRFLRARTGSVAVGTYQSEMVGPHSHANTCASTLSMNSYTPAGSISPSTYTPSGTVSTTINSSSGSTNFLSAAGGGISAPGSGSLAFGSVTASSSFSGNAQGFSFSGNAATLTGTITSTMTNVNNSGTENRPINAVALACIKY